jgi:hypothetical protein
MVRQALERDDYLGLILVAAPGLLFGRLTADDPEGLRRQLREFEERWPTREFYVLRHTMHVWRAVLDLYCGHAEAAWKRVLEYEASPLFPPIRYTRDLRIPYRVWRGCGALAASLTAADPEPLLRAAEQAARQLARERLPLPSAHALGLRAGIAARRGDLARARALLAETAAAFDALPMPLAAAMTRRRLGEITEGEAGRALVAEADAWMKARGIRNPARLSAMCLAGLPAPPEGGERGGC